MQSYQYLLALLSCFLTTVTIIPVSSEVYFKRGSPHVKLNDNAIISGSIEYSREGRPFSSFQGITYATIPARFEESKLETPSWEGVKSVKEPGPACLQRYFDGSSRGTEDCLSVNVYVPMNSTEDRRGYPVMIFCHGGGFMLGRGSGYGPKFFLDEDVILVTFNYRLGAFGFLSTGDSIIPGNYGMKDMVNLLKWTQMYIARFGGNPDKVTIFGESGGSVAVHYLMLSPLTGGLFHRAIGQSGGSTMLALTDPNPKGNAIQLATYLKCPTTAMEPSGITSKEILACLKNMPAEELNKAQFEYRECWPPMMRPFFFAPTPEPEETPNAFLTEYPMKILADRSRSLREVPWMMGATADEGGTMYGGWVAEHPELLEQLNADWDKVAPVAFDYGRYPLTKEQIQTMSKKIRLFYFGSKTEPITLERHRNNLTNLFSDQSILHSVHKAAMETAARGNKRSPVYLYQYTYRGPVSTMGLIFGLRGEETKKSCHADELQHLFDLSEELFPRTANAIKSDTPDEEFSKSLVKLWVSFAIHGEPRHFWGPAVTSYLYEKMKWRPLSKKQVDGQFPVKWWSIDTVSGYTTEPYKERMQFWDELFRDYFIPFYQQPSATPTLNAKTEL